MLNPEIRKHIWLDINISKLLIIPFTALLILLIIQPFSPGTVESKIFYYLSVFFIFFWGINNATSCIPVEFNQRTWEFIKQSSISPWQFTWGKLFGSTLMPWYGAIIYLGIYVFTANQLPAHINSTLLILFIGGIFAHSQGMLLSLNNLPEGTQKTASSFWFFILNLILSYWLVGGTLSSLHLDFNISWYGSTHQSYVFSFATLCLFTGFSLLGLYRSVKSAFHYTLYPIAWCAFHVVTVLYIAGFSPKFLLQTLDVNMGYSQDAILSSSAYYIALLSSILISYFALFSKAINRISYHKFLIFSNKNLKQALTNTPLWIISLCFTIFILVLSILSTLAQDVSPLMQDTYSKSSICYFLACLVAMLTRDICLHHYLAFGKNTLQRGVNTLFYLFILYFLIPWALHALGMSTISAFFIPHLDYIGLSFLSFVVQTIILGLLVHRRWRNLWLKT